MFLKILERGMTSGGVVGATSKVISRGPLIYFNPDLIEVGPNQLCRGITKPQFKQMVKEGQITKEKLEKEAPDLEHSDIGRQVVRGGDPNLLSWTRSIGAANLYGANRKWLPRDGVIVVGGLPAVFTDISQQAQMCPQMCDKEQRIRNEVFRIQNAGLYKTDPLESDGVARLVMGCEEVCAVVGKQDGVSFDNMYPVESCVDKIYHVIGTGRSHANLVPVASCLVDTFTNPDYTERALAVKIVLTSNKEYLEILDDTMKNSGALPRDHRVLTPKDAAVIMGDPELRQLATLASGPSGTMILSSVPKKLYGDQMLDYLKSELLKELMPQGPSDTRNKL